MDFFGGKARKGRPPGAAVVTTTRVAQAAPVPQRRQVPSEKRHNALPAAVQERIEKERVAAHQAHLAEQVAAADKKRAEAPRPAKKVRRVSVSEVEEAPKARARSMFDAVPGRPFQYNAPRTIVPSDDYAVLDKEPGGAMSSDELVRASSATYLPFFEGIPDETVVSLAYPARGAEESFLLLVPKDTDEYDPIADLLRTVGAIVGHYIPKERQDEFGALEALDVSSSTGVPLAEWRARARTRDSSSRDSTPLVDGASPMSQSLSEDALDTDSILRSFTKARNRRHGGLFVRTVQRFNALLNALKDEGVVEAHLRTLGATHGVPESVWRAVQDQVYARAAAPHVEKLKQYEAFSDNVYGEMLPPFLSEVCRLAQLGPQSVFVDLGSGIGNLIVQASLQTGCAAYGCEYMPIPSELAQAQLRESAARWKMWGLCGGPRMEAWCADFTDSEPVRTVLRDADLVLVNNYAFRPQTNDTLSLLFLDLKEGTVIVSLRSFVPSDFRLTERTLSSPAAILRVEERTYTSGSVSWTAGSGKYYVHVVDRSKVHAYAAALERRRQNP